MEKMTNKELMDMGFNVRKAKCGFCEKILLKGEGGIRIGSISHRRFYVCVGGCKK